MKRIFLLLLLYTMLFINPETTWAENNYYINKLKSAPVSQFDLYIYKLSEKLKCRVDRVSMTKTANSVTPCLTSIEFDANSNVLIMYFYVDSTNREMRIFSRQSKKNKEKTMMKILKKLAIELGVEGQTVGDEVIRLGTIQLTPVSYSSGDQSIGEFVEFYSEIADITEINLVTNVRSSVYKATRQTSGSYIYRVDKTKK